MDADAQSGKTAAACDAPGQQFAQSCPCHGFGEDEIAGAEINAAGSMMSTGRLVSAIYSLKLFSLLMSTVKASQLTLSLGI